MASRKLDEAIAAFRKTELMRFDLEQLEVEVGRRVAGLDPVEMATYVEATSEIAEAGDQLEFEAALAGWAPSTTRQRFRASVNAAGRTVA